MRLTPLTLVLIGLASIGACSAPGPSSGRGVAPATRAPDGGDAVKAKPRLLHRELVEGMPTGAVQEVRVVTGVLEPGVTTGYHTHRFPLAVYVLEGEFTLEVGDGEPVTLRAGEIAVEPANVRVVGYNAGTTVTRILDFYVSDPETPFVDPLE